LSTGKRVQPNSQMQKFIGAIAFQQEFLASKWCKICL